LVFQGYNLWPHMNVYENLAFGLKIRKVKKEEIRREVTDVLQLVRLPGAEKKYPSELSGGQQQRIALARSLLLKPAVLLLDEPFSALDAKLRHEMREELREIQAKIGLTMVFVTHDQEEALSISDRIIVMNQGRIEQIAGPQEIYDEPKTLYVARFIGKMNFLKGVVIGERIHVEQLSFPNTDKLSGNVSLAIRPENIILNEAGEGLSGMIKQIMVLGHYAEVTMDLNEHGIIKIFKPRDSVKDLHTRQNLKVTFSKILAYQTE
jgi:putative spermidine/putrescine transport system ATP-binding protein